MVWIVRKCWPAVRVLRVLFEFDKLLVETREVFVTLNKEFANYFLVLLLHALVLRRTPDLGFPDT